MGMLVRVAALAIAAASITACSGKASPSATLPPLTGTPGTSAGPTGSASPSPVSGSPSAGTSATSSKDASTSSSPSASAGPLGSPADTPVNDTSVAAAVKAATIAVGALTRAAYTTDTSDVDRVSAPECPCRDTARAIQATIKAKNAHIVGEPVSAVQTKVLTKTPTAVRVQVTYVSPAHKELDAGGKELQSVPQYTVTEVYQMNYIKDRWLVYFVEKP